MKKLFLGLLIIAAGAGAYFLLQNKNKTVQNNNDLQKEWITGQWKLDTMAIHSKDSAVSIFTGVMALVDTNFMKYRYDFRKEGAIIQSLADSVIADTAYYEWKDKNELVWKDAATDSTGESLLVTTLNTGSLVLHSKDSVVFYFTKLK